MKPICATRAANVKVNEGFWPRAPRERIYSVNFTVKCSLCRKRKWDRSYYDRRIRCLFAVCFVVGLFAWFIVTLAPLFRHYLTPSYSSSNLFALLYVSSFLLTRASYLSLAISLKEENLFRFSIANLRFGGDSLLLSDLSISVYRSNLYFIPYFIAPSPFHIDFSFPLFFFFFHPTYRTVLSFYRDPTPLAHDGTWWRNCLFFETQKYLKFVSVYVSRDKTRRTSALDGNGVVPKIG